jgi:two-component system C4-dicarboxylate transport response regulator DctD
MADAPKDVVMLIEDDDGMRAAVSQWLKLHGYDVTALAAPGQALSALDRHFSGVLVSDVRMPDMDGLELLRQMRDPEIPVVLMSAYRDIPLVVEAMQRGAYDFLEKPFDPERLVDVVRRASEKRRLTLENRLLLSQQESRTAS